MSISTRRVIAFLIACAVAFGVITLIDDLAAKSITLPNGGNLTAGAELKKAMEAGQIPFNSLLLVLGGWLVASYLGSTIASRLSGEKGPSQLFAILITLATLVTLTQATHPLWMWIGGGLGVPLIALGAAGESITLRKR